MKKLLALVLALVMVMGLATISSNAAFTDAADVSLKEAVDVMSAVGVFKGNESGAFDPKGNLDRQSAAKLIAYLDLGESTAEALPEVQAFPDVPASNWASKYIAYCKNAGYLSGDANGNFLPTTELSGWAFGKMVLCVLGYDANIEGFTGPNWSINIAKLMQSNNINDGIDGSASATLTREQAAQYCLNALKATMVEYKTKGTSIEINGATIATGASAATKVETTANYKSAIGGETAAPYTLQLGERLYTGKLTLTSGTTDAFGNKAAKWTYKAANVGTYDSSADSTFTAKVTYGDLYNALGDTAASNLGDVKIYVDGYLAVSGTNGVYNNGIASAFNAANIAKNSKTAFGYDATPTGTGPYTHNGDDVTPTGNGAVTNVFCSYDSTDAKYDIVITVTNTYLAKATADYNSSKKTLAIDVYNTGTMSSSTLSADDFEIANYKKGDFFLVNLGWDGATTYTVKKILPVTTVSDVKVSSYKATSNVVAAGTTYSYNQRVGVNDAGTAQGSLGYALYTTGYSINDSSYNFYLDANGYVVGVEGVSSSTDLTQYVFVKEAARSGFTVAAKLLFLDGSEKTVTVSKTAAAGSTATTATSSTSSMHTDGRAIAAGELSSYRFYTYSVNSDGTYTLYDLANTTRQDKAVATGDAAKKNIVSGAVQPIYTGATPTVVSKNATNSTVVIANKSVYTGIKKIPNVFNADVYYLLSSDGASILAAYTATAGKGGSSTNDYIYAFDSKSTSKDENGTTFYIYDIIRKGEKTTLNASGTSDSAPGLYNIQSYTDGYADFGTEITADDSALAKVIGSFSHTGTGTIYVENGALKVNTTYFVVDDDTQYFEIDLGDVTSELLSEGGVNNLDATTMEVYVIQKSSTDTTADYIYFVHA